MHLNLSGLDGVTSFFTDVIPELSVNFNVVLYYLPLKKDSMLESDYTFEFIANDLIAVLDELQLSEVSLVGESFGGIVAQHAAFMFPSRVRKLVVLSSLAKTELPPEIEWKVQYLLPILRTVGGLLPALGQRAFALIHAEDVVEATEPTFVRDLFIRGRYYKSLHRFLMSSVLNCNLLFYLSMNFMQMRVLLTSSRCWHELTSPTILIFERK